MKQFAMIFFLLTGVPFTYSAVAPTVSWDKNGRMKISAGGDTLVASEMLQVVNTAGWKVLFMNSKPRMQQGAVTTISQSKKGVCAYTKKVSVKGGTVSVDMSWNVEKGVKANANYYTVEIPAALIGNGAAQLTMQDGSSKTIALSSGSSKTMASHIRKAVLYSKTHTLTMHFTGNENWMLQNWTGTDHNCFRFRVEKALKGKPVAVQTGYTISAAPGSEQEIKRALAQGKEDRQEAMKKSLRSYGMISRKPFKMGPVTASAASVPQYTIIEFTFPMQGTWETPFDYEQVSVDAVIEDPDGKKITMPGFFYQPFRRIDETTIQRTGSPVWKVRFAPRKTGKYTCTINAKNKGKEATAKPVAFTATARKYRGMVRVSKANPIMLEHEDGTPYVPTGINLFFWHRLNSGHYENRYIDAMKFLAKLHENHANFIRLRIDSWWIAIENTADESGGWFGPGYYHQGNAYFTDEIFDEAFKKDIYVMTCMDNANGNVNDMPGERNAWRKAYNYWMKDFGGKLEKATDFWTDEWAKKHYRMRIRYFTARWGAHPNNFSWEFFNEVVVDKKKPYKEIAAWHAEMARYWKKTDPYNRLITTSIMHPKDDAVDAVWQLPEMEIVQHHAYDGLNKSEDLVAYMHHIMEKTAYKYPKPYFMGEYGVSYRSATMKNLSKNGIHFHNGMWGASFLKGCGSGAFWFIDNYLDPNGLWYHYKAFMDFANTMPWNAADFKTLETSMPKLAKKPQHLSYVHKGLATRSAWSFKKTPVTDFHISPNGQIIKNAEYLSPSLHCRGKRKTAPVFHFNSPAPMEFRVRVTCSVGNEINALAAYLDGKKIRQENIPAGEGLGKKSTHMEKYNNWRSEYENKEVIFKIPAGQHSLKLEAVGKDRLEVEYGVKAPFEYGQPLRVLGLQCGGNGYLWIQNMSSTWRRMVQNEKVIPLAECVTTVKGLKDGAYIVEWWDTWKGGVYKKASAFSEGGNMTITIPPVKNDTACRIIRQ